MFNGRARPDGQECPSYLTDGLAGPSYDDALVVLRLPADQLNELVIRLEAAELLGELLHRVDRVHRRQRASQHRHGVQRVGGSSISSRRVPTCEMSIAGHTRRSASLRSSTSSMLPVPLNS